MLAIDIPQPAHKKLSLFLRFARKPIKEQVLPTNNDVYNNAVRPPSRLRKSPAQTSLPTPPLSPARSKNDSVLDIQRPPSPHLTKDKVHRKGRTNPYTERIEISHTQRVEIPNIVRERLSRESSSSSTYTSSVRVEANAIPTKPFPSASQRVTTWDVYLPPTQVHALYLGYLPYEMSDKWFIYSEGPDAMGKLKVHFHRSWTGTKIAELFVVMDVKGGGAGKIVGIKWNGGEEVGSGRMNGDEVKYLVRTTVRSVIGIEFEDEY
jgi:hypothetical protein